MACTEKRCCSRGDPSTLTLTSFTRPASSVATWARAGPGLDDLHHRAVPGAGVGPGGHRVVPGRIEHRAEVVTARVAEPGQHADGLLPDLPHTLDDGVRIRLGVGQRAVQVVDDRQPFPGHRSPGLLLGLADLAGAALAQVIQVSQRAQPEVLQLSDAVQQVRDRGVVGRAVLRRGCRSGVRLEPAFPVSIPLGHRPAHSRVVNSASITSSSSRGSSVSGSGAGPCGGAARIW